MTTTEFYALSAALVLGTLLFFRLLYILPSTNPRRPLPRKRGTPTHLLVILGSGGHTAEMLSLLADLDPNAYTHRTYIISSGDDFSASRAVEFEKSLVSSSAWKTSAITSNQAQARSTTPSPPYSLHFVPRARKIHQSLLTAPFSSFQCFVACMFSLHPAPESASSPSPPGYPDLILLNGPATSVIVLLAALFLRFMAVRGTSGKMRSIYIESWARVKGLSLSGRILVATGAVDRVLVQWEGLAGTGRGEFRGCLVR